MRALTGLVHQAKIRYIGGSTFPASQIVEAQWVARARGLQRFVTEQPAYSMLVRRIEDDILLTCQRHGTGVVSYSPLTGGWPSGRWRKDSGQQISPRQPAAERFELSQPANQRKLDAVEALAQFADQTAITLIEITIAFVINHPAITSAVIGPRTMDQFDGQLAAADVVLDADVLDKIDQIVAPGTTINPVDNSFDNPALARSAPCTPVRRPAKPFPDLLEINYVAAKEIFPILALSAERPFSQEGRQLALLRRPAGISELAGPQTA